MASQFLAQLMEVAASVRSVGDQFETFQRERAARDQEFSDLLQRVSRLEEAKDWTGEERRKVDHRLESGDHTFALLQHQVKTAEAEAKHAAALASQALEQLQKLEQSRKVERESEQRKRTEREKERDKKRWDLKTIAITSGIGLVGFAGATVLAILLKKWGLT